MYFAFINEFLMHKLTLLVLDVVSFFPLTTFRYKSPPPSHQAKLQLPNEKVERKRIFLQSFLHNLNIAGRRTFGAQGGAIMTASEQVVEREKNEIKENLW